MSGRTSRAETRRPAGPRLRIAMVSEHASPLSTLGGVDGGGQNVHVDALARALGARGHEVVVHTRRDDPDLPPIVRLAPGVTVHHVDAGPAQPIPKDELLEHMGQFAEVLREAWRTTRPDVVHAHFWMSALACLDAAPAVDAPVAVTFHALGSVKRRHQAEADTSPASRLADERRIAHDADRIIATATEELAELRDMGATDARVSVVPCGVDTRHFSPVGPQAPRGDLPHRLLTISRLVPRKGVDDAIRAAAQLPHCELVVAGGPAPEALEHDPEVRRLRRLAASLDVLDRVRFVGAVPRPDVPALIRSADLVLCLPWYEPFGIVPLEAMACGRPVVGAAVGGLLDTIEDGRTGLLVPPRTPDAAALAVRRLLSSPGLRTAMGEQGPRTAAERYDWARVAEATEAVYHELVLGAPLAELATPLPTSRKAGTAAAAGGARGTVPVAAATVRPTRRAGAGVRR
ncbi:MAG TPA: glycosyltransferase [Candidatus Nanopelagicales bacterium]